MAERWRHYEEDLDLQRAIAHSFGLSHIAARVLVNRGVRNTDTARGFLEPTLSDLSDPFLMNGMDRAVERVLAALAAREPIVVYGDSDVDGVSGTALLAGFLKSLGAEVSTYIPSRLEEGYSLTRRGLDEIARRGARVVITVDNGTTAAGPVAELQNAGIDVIVTDHHVPPGVIPACTAFLNPKWHGSGYPFPHLCGTGVSFQLLAALATRLPARGRALEAMRDLVRHSIAYVALATICDMVPLVGENRALARAGIAALNDTRHPGLRALLSIAGVGRRVAADDVSFRLGPRINAAGRLGQAGQALALLLADDEDEARRLARELDDKNSRRQELEAEILRSAREQAVEAPADDPVLLLANERWHSGVVGIVANRLALEFRRPTVLIGLRDGVGRASGRSIGGFDLHAALSRCAGHLNSFGGHPYAAGFEIDAARIGAFRTALMAAARENTGPARTHELWIDGEVQLGALTPPMMQDLDRLAPFGESNAVPVFTATALRLAAAPRIVGRTRAHVSFTVQQAGLVRKAIGYGMAQAAERLQGDKEFALAFTPRLSAFHGGPSVEMEVKDIRFDGDAR